MNATAQRELDELGMTPEALEARQARVAEMLHKDVFNTPLTPELSPPVIANGTFVVNPPKPARRAPVKGVCGWCGKHHSRHTADGHCTSAADSKVFTAAFAPSDAPAATPAPAGGITREQAQELYQHCGKVSDAQFNLTEVKKQAAQSIAKAQAYLDKAIDERDKFIDSITAQ